MSPILATGPASPDDGRLAAIIVKGPNQTVFDLSSRFQPDVAEYGVMVPQTFEMASLCVKALQGEVRNMHVAHLAAVKLACMRCIATRLTGIP